MSQLGKVLIIDDEANLRQTLTRILQKIGCDTIAAANGNEALELLSQGTFDLVYLDIHLPELDGIQLLKEIRQREPDLAVILLTGYGTMQSAVEALRLGATDYLLKPFDPEVLVARTRTILRERTIERRRREIREQITALRAELEELEREIPEQPKPVTQPPLPRDRFIKRGELILDLKAQRATFGDRVLALPPAAVDYLVVLAKHSPNVVDYQALVSEAQSYQVGTHEARELAKWHIHVLRQALEADPQNPGYILNVRGVGYRLIVD